MIRLEGRIRGLGKNRASKADVFIFGLGNYVDGKVKWWWNVQGAE